MAEEIPPKMTRESREPHEGVSQITVQTGEKEPTPEKVVEESHATPEQVTKTEEKTGETEATSEKVVKDSSTTPEKLRAKLSMEQLMSVGAKKLPATLEEIPEYLFTPGTKQYETARLIIMEGITDNDILN